MNEKEEEPKAEVLTLLHFNDVYEVDARKGREPVGGAARFSSLCKQMVAENPLLFFGGDAFNPSLLSTLTKGKHMVPVLNELGISAAVLGNHDFDFGVKVLKKYMDRCNFPWLLSNVVDSDTGQPLADAKKYLLFTHQGIKIGVMGLAEEEWLAAVNNMPETVKYIDFIEEGNRLVTLLREQGADVIICLVHMRKPNDSRLANGVKGIDLILSGHDHFYDVFRASDSDTLIVKGGCEFRQLTVLKVYLKNPHPENTNPPSNKEGEIAKSGRVYVSWKTVQVNSDIPEDPAMNEIVGKFEAMKEEKMRKVLCWSSVELNAKNDDVRSQETNLGNFISDVVRNFTSTDVVLINGGGIRSNTTYGPGEFKLGDLVSILPFPDIIMVIEVTADMLREALENAVSQLPALGGKFVQISGFRFAFDPSMPPGKRVCKVMINSEEIMPGDQRKLLLATQSFVAKGHEGFTMFKHAPVVVDEENGVMLSSLMRQHFIKLRVLNLFRNYRVGLLVRTAFRARSKKQVGSVVPQKPKGADGGEGDSKLPNIAPIIDGRIEELCQLNVSDVRNQYQLEVAQAHAAETKGNNSDERQQPQQPQQPQQHQEKEQKEEDLEALSKEELIAMVKRLKQQIAEIQQQHQNNKTI